MHGQRRVGPGGSDEMKIVLFADDLLGWQGGRDFLRILFASLELGCDAKDKITIGTRSRDSLFWRVARIAKHLLTKFPYDYDWIGQEIRRVSRNKLITEMMENRIRPVLLRGKGYRFKFAEVPSEYDAVGPFMFPPDWLGSDAWVGYLPDCQHRRLPHFSLPKSAQREIFSSRRYWRLRRSSSSTRKTSRLTCWQISVQWGPRLLHYR